MVQYGMYIKWMLPAHNSIGIQVPVLHLPLCARILIGHSVDVRWLGMICYLTNPWWHLRHLDHPGSFYVCSTQIKTLKLKGTWAILYRWWSESSYQRNEIQKKIYEKMCGSLIINFLLYGNRRRKGGGTKSCNKRAWVNLSVIRPTKQYLRVWTIGCNYLTIYGINRNHWEAGISLLYAIFIDLIYRFYKIPLTNTTVHLTSTSQYYLYFLYRAWEQWLLITK